MYESTKILPAPDKGYPCAYRNHKADSHCRWIHGYDYRFKLTFRADELDRSDFVVDFGDLGWVKEQLEKTFDHTLLIDEEDPYKDEIAYLTALDVANVLVMPGVGCERFADMVFEVVEQWLKDAGYAPRVWLYKVEVFENGTNSASRIEERKCL